MRGRHIRRPFRGSEPSRRRSGVWHGTCAGRLARRRALRGRRRGGRRRACCDDGCERASVRGGGRRPRKVVQRASLCRARVRPALPASARRLVPASRRRRLRGEAAPAGWADGGGGAPLQCRRRASANRFARDGREGREGGGRAGRRRRRVAAPVLGFGGVLPQGTRAALRTRGGERAQLRRCEAVQLRRAGLSPSRRHRRV